MPRYAYIVPMQEHVMLTIDLFIVDCGCSEAVISPQCNENGVCMCIEGAIGEKCDECGFEYSGTNYGSYII